MPPSVHRYLAILLLLTPVMLLAQLDIPHVHPEASGTCKLPPLPDGPIYRRPYVFQSGTPAKALTFSINYLPADTVYNGRSCQEWPDSAKTAFNYAAAIWADVLEGNFTINVNACYTALGPGVLGSAGSSLAYGLGPVFGQDYVLFSQALTENLVGQELSGPDINAYFNSGFDYYFDIDANPPPGKFDFVSLVVHELGHGLGFAGTGKYDNGVEGFECSGIEGDGCVGQFTNLGGTIDFHPYAYDMFVNRISDDSLLHDVRPHPGQVIGDALTSSGDAILFNAGNFSTFSTATNLFPLYAPATFQPGSSYSHFSNPSEIMYYGLSPGSALHDVGNAPVIMESMGWLAAVALPVEWLAFSATDAGARVALNWETAAEKDNSHFEVEASRDGRHFSRIGTVAATGHKRGHYLFHDERVAAGDNFYRLRQVDYDGRASYSRTVHLYHDDPSTPPVAVYPNPAAGPSVRVHYRSGAGGVLRIALTDAVGRIIRDAAFPLNAGANQLSLDVSTLPPGLYSLILREGNASHHQKLIVY